MTIKEVLENTLGILNDMVIPSGIPFSSLEPIVVPISKATSNLRLVLDAFANEEERQKNETEKGEEQDAT